MRLKLFSWLDWFQGYLRKQRSPETFSAASMAALLHKSADECPCAECCIHVPENKNVRCLNFPCCKACPNCGLRIKTVEFIGHQEREARRKRTLAMRKTRTSYK